MEPVRTPTLEIEMEMGCDYQFPPFVTPGRESERIRSRPVQFASLITVRRGHPRCRLIPNNDYAPTIFSPSAVPSRRGKVTAQSLTMSYGSTTMSYGSTVPGVGSVDE